MARQLNKFLVLTFLFLSSCVSSFRTTYIHCNDVNRLEKCARLQIGEDAKILSIKKEDKGIYLVKYIKGDK